jgi:MSHA pilin protein MshD
VKPAARCSGQRGFTLIDVLVLIVLLGLVAGSLTVLFSRLAAQSAESMKARQSTALAQSLLAEVRAMPFTFCDAQATNAATATRARAADYGGAVDGLGAEGTETRYGTATTPPVRPADRFDSVTDYRNVTLPGAGCPGGICNSRGQLLNGPGTPLEGCSATVAVAAQALPGIAALDADGAPQALRIGVSVLCPGQPPVLAEGVRVRHAPNLFF